MLEDETIIRLTAFITAIVVMALWEELAPRRRATVAKLPRRASNLGITLLAAVVMRLIPALSAVAAATLAAQRGWGLLHQVTLPAWVAIVLAALALDFIIYLQHRLFHAIPALWRLHALHHADNDFDFSLGVRFHPLEIMLSMVLKMAAVVLLGAGVMAVILFEVVLNASAVFNHGNVRIPAALERVLRWIVVTPDMHRVHHSAHTTETDSNFGFNLPWWDRLFGTYIAQPRDGHEGMTIGLAPYQQERRQNLWWLLVFPFRRGSDRHR